jgi:hypothetical protein
MSLILIVVVLVLLFGGGVHPRSAGPDLWDLEPAADLEHGADAEYACRAPTSAEWGTSP